MTEKNSKNNQNSKKKYKWFAVLLITLLLLLIGFAGYYLEKDLGQVPDDKLKEQKNQAQNEMQDSISDNQTGDANGSENSFNQQSAADNSQENSLNNQLSDNIKNDGNKNIKDQPAAVENSAAADDDFSEKISDPSIVDRILSILGLKESDFSQNLNILFVGLDDEESVTIGSVEADSIMLGKLRPEKNKLEVININENTIYEDQPLSDYYNGKLKKSVEIITASKIDHYVYVNYKGFEKVIDEFGGVEINLEKKVEVPALGLNLKAGTNLLSGKEALNFVRWKDNNSFDRFARQKLVIRSVINKLQGNNISFKVKDLYHTIVESYKSVKTDINPVLAAEIFSYIKQNDDFSLEFND